MRLVLANAILGAALTWAVLHERPSPLPDPATAEVIGRPAGSASDDRDTPLAAPLAGELEPRPTDATPAGPPPAAASPIERAERLAALDALVAEMESFALQRRR